MIIHKFKGRTIFVVLLLIFGVCMAQKNTKSISKFEIFENEEVHFKYPESWRTFETIGFENDVFVRIAPKTSILKYKLRYVKIKVFDSIKKSYEMKKPSKEWLKKYKKKTSESSGIQFNISLERLDGQSLSDYMSKRKAEFEQRQKYVNLVIKKKSDDYFINEVLMKSIAKSKVIDVFHYMHYVAKNDLLYILVFTVPLEKLPEYKADADYIFNNIEFKN